MKNNMPGKVYLIGAGPGDPGLITVKGRQCLATADVIVYDFLASPLLLADVSSGAERIYVGKRGGDHTLSQDGINRLIAEKARQGLTVARLKGGDPFIFGRGGEEAEYLIAAGIPFEVVPGVTSAVAAPAYAGIPLTHRKFTATVAFVTGHEDPEKPNSNIDWPSLANGMGTIVFFMGVKNLPMIVERLLHCGRKKDTPVALVRWGTTAKQVTVSGTLENIVEKSASAGIKAPAIIVVGEVVGLREKLMWFEKRPLFGKTVVVTRARAQASALVDRLTDLGAECLVFPTIRVAPPEDNGPMDRAIRELSGYDWLIFTSVNGVDAFFKHLFAADLDVRALHHIQTACIGPATAERLRDWGLNTDILPESFRAESVIDAFSNEKIAGKRILLPRAASARPLLPVELTRMGAVVNEVPAYETRQDRENAGELIRCLEDGSVHMVTFTSSSTVTNFKALLPEDRFDVLTKNLTVACIGPITAATAREAGFNVHITAAEYTIDGLCRAIVDFFRKE